MVKFKKLTVELSVELVAKVKAYAAFSNIPMRVFISRVLMDKINKIEKGEDKTIQIKKRTKK